MLNLNDTNDNFMPLHMFFVLCEQCNLSCGHCIQSSHPKAVGQLDCYALSNWLCNAESDGLVSVDFSGGEPLLAGGFPELLQSVLETTSLEITIASNLSMVKKLDGGILRKNAHRLHWRVALEGVDAISHDAMRAKGSFAALLSGLEYLREHGIVELSCNTIMRPDVLKLLPSFVEILASYEFKRHNWICLLPFGRGIGYDHWGMAPDVWFDYLTPLASMLSRIHNIEINLYGPILESKKIDSRQNNLLDENSFLAISAFTDGSVYCNCYLQAFISKKPIGSIFCTDFAGLKKSANKGFKQRKCENCQFRFVCFGIKKQCAGPDDV